MEIITLAEALTKLKQKTTSLIKKGKVFIYPTDTIYGLGCNAEISDSVWRIRSIKRSQKPFSVIAPSKEWILENLVIKHPEYLDKFPGPITLILGKRKPILKEASRLNTLGVRMPNHPFTKIIQEAGVPFITTSANISGQKPIKQIADIPDEIREKIDMAIDAGVLNNPPSEIIDLSGEEATSVKRNDAEGRI